MSKFLTGRNIAIAGGAAALVYIIPRTPSGSKINPLNTTGVQQIEDRFTSGGATPTHTPGVATRTGTTEHAVSPQQKEKGYGSDHYKENITSQRPESETKSSVIGKKWYGTHIGSEEGR